QQTSRDTAYCRQDQNPNVEFQDAGPAHMSKPADDLIHPVVKPKLQPCGRQSRQHADACAQQKHPTPTARVFLEEGGKHASVHCGDFHSTRSATAARASRARESRESRSSRSIPTSCRLLSITSSAAASNACACSGPGARLSLLRSA